MSVELITEASLKKLLYAFSMVANCVTRVGSNLANSYSVIEKQAGNKVGAISKAQNLKGGPFGLCETPAGCKNFF